MEAQKYSRSADSSVVLSVGIVGAGPAGLTAALLLGKAGVKVDVFEEDPACVGGISRTVAYKGFRFDIGGHRFFSKSQEVVDLWHEILPNDLITRKRQSRLLYKGKLYNYPLEALQVLENLGKTQSLLCFASYVKVKARHRLGLISAPKSLEDWVVFNFGWRLYLAFFKAYTEKLWGVPCNEIAADWAVQRIRGLSLKTAALSMLRATFKSWSSSKESNQIKTLITSFTYPRLGPGMMWEAAADQVRANGGRVFHGARVTSIDHDERQGLWHLKVSDRSTSPDQEHKGVQGVKSYGPYHHVISSAPLASVIHAISKPLPAEAITAADSLSYRDFILVALILKERTPFPDQWLYIHDPDLKVGRIQNFQNWSPELVDGSGLACYGMEYFCFRTDELWGLSDEELIELATRELVGLELVLPGDVVDGCVVRQAKAYPLYDDNYQHHIDIIKNTLAAHCPGLHQVGRNGMHRYNNQDHSMMTAMLTTRNILNQNSRYDPWLVNQDAEYIEEQSDSTPST